MMGLSTIQKVTSCLRQLATGCAADSVDEYLRMGETTSLASLKRFILAIKSLFGPEFLRPPRPDELKTVMAEYEERGFPGCKGSIDGMHWQWKNCPAAWAGQFKGKEKKPTIVSEGVVSKNLCFWHSFVGAPGALNDINVLNRSPLFRDYIRGSYKSSILSLFKLLMLWESSFQERKTWLHLR